MLKWEKLPDNMRNSFVKQYYDKLYKKRFSLLVKRIFDITFSVILLTVLCIPMIMISIAIKLDSKGPVFYRQPRVTKNGKIFRIHKFRTMVVNADNFGPQITVNNDKRITKVGSHLRNLRLDELPQIIDVLQGNMSFVGTRPESVKYVAHYSEEMLATLLLPAGITSRASVMFKDESRLLDSVEDVEKYYIDEILPIKMIENLKYVEKFSIFEDLRVIIKTVYCVFFKYKGEEL